jgi:hypothetical protein
MKITLESPRVEFFFEQLVTIDFSSLKSYLTIK